MPFRPVLGSDSWSDVIDPYGARVGHQVWSEKIFYKRVTRLFHVTIHIIHKFLL